MGKDNPKDKVPRLPEARRQLDVLVRALPGRRTMIEDIIRRNRDATHIPGVRLYGGTATEREAWVDWYDRDLLKARAVADLDRRLPAPPTVAETARESYRQLERWCSDARGVLAKGTRPIARRRKVPEKTKTEVKRLSAGRCCVCFGRDRDDEVKQGQIAHLDDDSSNNDLDNLAWLCPNHHAELHTRGYMTTGLSANDVKGYRAQLYRANEEKEVGPRSRSSRKTASAGRTSTPSRRS